VAAPSPQHSPGPAYLRDLLELVVALAALLRGLQRDFVVIHKGLVDPQLAGLRGAGVSRAPGAMLNPPQREGPGSTVGTLPRAVPSWHEALPDHSQLAGPRESPHLGQGSGALAQSCAPTNLQNPAESQRASGQHGLKLQPPPGKLQPALSSSPLWHSHSTHGQSHATFTSPKRWQDPEGDPREPSLQRPQAATSPWLPASPQRVTHTSGLPPAPR